MIYTPTAEVSSLSGGKMAINSNKITEEEIKLEMSKLKAEVDANVRIWDMQNKIK